MSDNEETKEELAENENGYVIPASWITPLQEYKEPICMYCETTGETGGIEFHAGSEHMRFCPGCVKKLLQCAVAVTKEYHKEKLS
jgi:hypothetical protein